MYVYITITVFILGCSAPLWGSEETEETEKTESQLETMTVIATKTPKAPIDSPASTSIITEEEINAFSAEDPFTPLNLTEGIWPRSYRGLADYWARPMIRGHRALIMVDGVNWYDYGYYYQLSSIPMPDVERIDVVRGPFSALYGSVAQTGVINYITKVPEGRTVDASVSYGSWDSRFYQIRLGDRPFSYDPNDGEKPSWWNSALGNKFFYSFSFKSRTSDGYATTPSYKYVGSPVSNPDPNIPVVSGWSKDVDPRKGKTRYLVGSQGDNWYEDYGLFFKTGYDLSLNSRIWYSLNISKFKYGWRDGKSYLRDPSGNAVYDGDVYFRDGGDLYEASINPYLFTSDPKEKKSVAHTLHYDQSVPGTIDILGLLAYNDKETSTHYQSKSRNKDEDSYLLQADLSTTLHFLDDRFLLTTGAQGIQEKAKVEDNNLSDPHDKSSSKSLRERTSGINRTLGVFVQGEYELLEALTAYLGGRYDHWWGSDADYLNEDGNYIAYPDTSDGHFSPKASLVYHPLENGCIRASYGEAFTAPSLYYRTANYYWEGGGTISTAKPNPNLKPTTNKSWELGTEWEFLQKWLRVKATYFHNDFDDLIVNLSKTTILPNGTELIEKQRVNAESARVEGIETAIEAILPYNMKGGVFYTHQWSKYTKTVDPSKEGWQLNETPSDILTIWLGYFGRRFDASVSYRYCDSRYDDDYTAYSSDSYGADDDYQLVDLKVAFRPMEHVQLSVSIENLFDAKYYEYYLGPGRFILGTLSVSF